MFCQPGFEFIKNTLGSSNHNYLEIGVFNGDGLQGIALANPTKMVYGIDPFIEDGYTEGHTGVKRNHFMAKQKINTLANIRNCTNIKLFEETSRQFADNLNDSMIDELDVAFVLIDGSHHYEDVVNDVHLAMRLIGNRTGAIVFDDANLDDVNRAYQVFLTDYAGKYSELIDLYSQHPGHIIAHVINPTKDPVQTDNK